ncbi:unnamed protein product [Caenorhabditis sp. 36 PRJEB53466]|nr:unnamed protein product [Caenorhabditis sp. 36 PRJEB53466]
MKAWILGVLVVLMPLWISADDIKEVSYEFDANTNITLRIDIAQIVISAMKQNCGIKMQIKTKDPVDYKIIKNGGAILGSMQPITEEVLLFQDAWHAFLLNFQPGRARRFQETIFEIAFAASVNTTGNITFSLGSRVAFKKLPVQRSNNKTLVVIHHIPEKWKETIYSYPVSLTNELEMGLLEGRIRLETNSSGRVEIAFAKCNLQTANVMTPSFGPNLNMEMSLYIRLLGHLTCPIDRSKSFHLVIVSSSKHPTPSFDIHHPVHNSEFVLVLVVGCASLFFLILLLIHIYHYYF